MAVTHGPRFFGLVALTIGGLLLAGCNSSDSGGSDDGAKDGDKADTSKVLGTPNPASGDPVVFGAINLESGPITFPETLLAEQAAVDYVNEYRGGIGGHPIKLVTCVSDGQPATAQRCANQILDQDPVAIMGAADIGAPGAIPVWERAGLAYLGGVPFTPVEQNYANAVLFSSIASGDNAAAAAYAVQELDVDKAAIIYTSDTQGTATADIIESTMKNAGASDVTKIALPPTSSDVSSAVATAIAASPDAIYVDAPAACPNILASLKQLGNQAKILGVDVCTSPPAIAGANGGADGLYFASPVLDPFAGTDESELYLAALKEYAPADIALDSLSTIGFQTVINVQAALADFTTDDLTTEKILAAFRTGSAEHNFMGHDYTCDGEQLAGASALCNAYEQIRQVKGDTVVVAQEDFVTAAEFYVPPSH